MIAHTPGPWYFRPFSMSDEEIAGVRKHGLEPVGNCNNDGERYIMQGTPQDDIYSRVALVATRLERVRRGKNATPYDAPDAERDANARLIAAAPDLLAALQKAKPIVGAAVAGSTNEARPIRERVYQQLEAAIAKALAK